jgi:uncharacterized protein YceK
MVRLQIYLWKSSCVIEILNSHSSIILYFVDRASRNRFLLTTNAMHFFMYLFICFISVHVSSNKCSSSGDRIVGTQSYPDRHTKQSLTQTNHTRWCINTIRSPDDEHLLLETCTDMKQINKYMKKCIELVISKNPFKYIKKQYISALTLLYYPVIWRSQFCPFCILL